MQERTPLGRGTNVHTVFEGDKTSASVTVRECSR